MAGMADAAIVDAAIRVIKEDQELNGHARPRNIRKRKRQTLSPVNLSAKEKEAHIEALRKELNELFAYYKEVKDKKLDVELSGCASRNGAIAVLMEESDLPLSRLVDQIYKDGRERACFVKSSVLFVGQRLMYGMSNADAGVLEDDSESVLEEEDERGVAHIVEHLAFSATKRCTNHDIVKFLESIGAEFGACQNAVTSSDDTVYELFVPVDKPELLSQAI